VCGACVAVCGCISMYGISHRNPVFVDKSINIRKQPLAVM
jgi:hypothetical protein